MPVESYRETLLRAYMALALLRNSTFPPAELDVIDHLNQLSVDLETFALILNTRYLELRTPLPRAGSLQLAWVYAQENPGRFRHMLRMTPFAFYTLFNLIKDHPVFHNNSNSPQTSVETQLAVTLYRLGRYGNGASVADVAHISGQSEGSVINFTRRCFTAITSLQQTFVRPLTAEEKEKEKQWVEERVGFHGLWREGWLMYDGTIVVLHNAPSLHGDAYYTRKGNYGFNVQIGNTPSNLRIVDFSCGFTGSAHDSTAFEYTAAFKHPDWLFHGEEFCWADSAYPLSSHCITVHKKPASFTQENKMFDGLVSRIRVRSEHCIGALKQRFQCLNGLRISIASNQDHEAAMQWIVTAIILHNFLIDVEGSETTDAFLTGNFTDNDIDDDVDDDVDDDIDLGEDVNGQEKRRRLIAELLAFKEN